MPLMNAAVSAKPAAPVVESHSSKIVRAAVTQSKKVVAADKPVEKPAPPKAAVAAPSKPHLQPLHHQGIDDGDDEDEEHEESDFCPEEEESEYELDDDQPKRKEPNKKVSVK